MLILPAIDLRNGKCVRLKQGRVDQETVYSDDPVAMAQHWEKLGAKYLHLVDLDGAFHGHPIHIDTVGAIVTALNIPVELGGGLRTADDVQRAVNVGVNRVILGTSALERQDLIPTLVKRFGNRIAVGIDARDGMVALRGWTQTSSISAVELASKVSEMGVQTLIYTDIATDGMLQGPNIDGLKEIMSAVTSKVIASGGVTTMDDLRSLQAVETEQLLGAIIGKALYDNQLDLRTVIAEFQTRTV
ncbi:MAG: 1-(5-phosphoribosyl)-5-[(5-phosphoribosylamino)methylideneamino]imidazole-4-carboxamide isomerase [Verrucomicrobiota bacterium]|jgi:phosphoribosylformimino-5-aminoimidazole carboxamide ribotide isomerase